MGRPLHFTSRIIVGLSKAWAHKLEELIDAQEIETLLAAADALNLAELQKILADYPELWSAGAVTSLTSHTIKRQTELDRRLRAGRDIRGIAGFFAIDVAGIKPASRVAALLGRLNSLECVGDAYREPKYGPTSKQVGKHRTQTKGTNQPASSHLDAAPHGVGVRHSNGNWIDLTGAGIGFADVESRGHGWNLHHEAFAHVLFAPGFVRPTVREGGGHGTMAIGVVLGAREGRKASGAAPHCVLKALVPVGDPDGTEDVPWAIAAAAAELEPGDVLLLELSWSDNMPLEVNYAEFSAIEAATEKGIVVIEPAGNNDIDLDEAATDPEKASYWSKRLRSADGEFPDSGAIIVSGCGFDPEAKLDNAHRRMSNLNFGSPVDCYAWGEMVKTTGVGLDHTTANGSYDDTFDMTSAAAAIIAGVALLAQEKARGSRAGVLSPAAMRDLLSTDDLGTRVVNAGGRNGRCVMPDISRIARQLETGLPAHTPRRRRYTPPTHLGPKK